jgi:hypothetical protein
MITEAYFEELVKDLFSEYLPKVKAAERKEFVAALLDELKAQDIEFEEPAEEETEVFGVDSYHNFSDD